ncbi:ferredoxin [Kitasatospora sp. NBC_00240]|uniref:ferredoxin n=1 Tax=Kitasatospora sp. NBC_00240 TaxID=2903567 RepID=UPI002253F42A|nr:ferredoxin [Kitasatospora sp. NBC_00240]MCX5208615.1 ferredoxin [Kitasatospora sp. NBC_00240]
MLITADRDRCIGAGLCVLTAPDVFEHDDDGLVHVLEQEPDARLEGDVRLAQQLCPARALALDTAAPQST